VSFASLSLVKSDRFIKQGCHGLSFYLFGSMWQPKYLIHEAINSAGGAVLLQPNNMDMRTNSYPIIVLSELVIKSQSASTIISKANGVVVKLGPWAAAARVFVSEKDLQFQLENPKRMPLPSRTMEDAELLFGVYRPRKEAEQIRRELAGIVQSLSEVIDHIDKGTKL